MYINSCGYCGEEFEGRKNQRFCCAQCRSSFHNEKVSQVSSTYSSILRQLKLNRRLLKVYNRAGLSFVRKAQLDKEGFDPKYFTHQWKSRNNKVYHFCFEFGFHAAKRDGKIKYTLVHWQDYMK